VNIQSKEWRKVMIEVVDTTRLRDSLSCLRLYYWRHERAVVPKAPRLPLIYGAAIHASLAGHYLGESAGKCLAEFEEIWDTDIPQDALTEDDPKRNPVRWAEVFLAYRQKYQTEPFRVRNVEVPFFLPLTDQIAIGGVIDLVIEYLGQIMLVDHKTTSYMNHRYFATFNPNHQAVNYLLAANKLIKPDQFINTLLFNCILVHATESRPERLFERVPTTRSPAQLAEGQEQLVGWWNIVRACRSSGSWPMNDHYCQEWGGCAYHQLCTDVQANFRRLIPSKVVFKESAWDPIRELRKHGLKETI
jgi:hypothetical protein